MDVNVKRLVVGMYQTNCYLLEKDGHCLIIDPGKKADRIQQYVENSVVDGIVLTHGHFDHIGAVDDLAKVYKCPVYLHEEDFELVRNCPYNAMGGYSGSIHTPLTKLTEGIQKIGTFDVEVIEAPGHTEGSVLVIFEDIMFSGDVLFQGSIGRTDLYKGNESVMRQTLKMFKQMNKNYTVLPGHGDPTTLEQELAYNPFL